MSFDLDDLNLIKTVFFLRACVTLCFDVSIISCKRVCFHVQNAFICENKAKSAYTRVFKPNKFLKKQCKLCVVKSVVVSKSTSVQ